MLTEVNLSPKPGLVDRLNCGAHKDMSLTDFHRSALAIQAWLPRFIEYGACSAKMPADAVLTGLRPLGMACEADMFRATAGVNTHKGSIFSLGLLCAAIGRLHQQQQPITPETICTTAAHFCRGLTERELRNNNQQLTAGQRLYQQLGLTGARGEAEAGYPLVIRHALPHYRDLLAEGRDPELALLQDCAGYSSRQTHCYNKGASEPPPISIICISSTATALNAISALAAVPTC